MELYKARYNKGLGANLYYYRDSQQHEVDIIYKRADDLIPIEVKSSETFNSDFLRGLKYFQSLVGERCPEGYLVYAGDREILNKTFLIRNYKTVSKIID
ncbi:MAG: DUF4143 domain-containing protein [Gammaproteobacteria bacterium]